MRIQHSIVVAMAVLLVPPLCANGQERDALVVEWHGKRLCEYLHEDEQIRILRCTFPPGTKHVRHEHPADFVYTLSGGKLDVQTAAGTKSIEGVTDAYVTNAPTPWHEVTNTGDTTLRYLVVEMKYKK